MKIHKGIFLGSLIALAVAGCGLSPTYQYESLANSSDYEVCYALTDPRKEMSGSGWKVRAEVAQKIVRERGISCDRSYFSTAHNLDAQSRALNDLSTQRYIQQIQTSAENSSSN
ncbi:hypothetical protein HJ207_24185 [Vibrio parahaemolyticus]|nr:hypothetical protein [Vibrio parahaemolyticus]MBE3770643.1 hypothetical protein [Vibrio parahaemolyticus]